MIKHLSYVSIFLLGITLSSCGESESYQENDDLDVNTSHTSEVYTNDNSHDEMVAVEEKTTFYTLDFEDRGVLADNAALEKATCVTLKNNGKLSRTINFEWYEPANEVYTAIGFLFTPKKDQMKMETGVFKTIPISGVLYGEGKEALNNDEVYLLGVIDKDNYNIGLEKDLLKEISERFVVLEDKENTIEITSVEDIESEKENELASISSYMVLGQQQVKGTYALHLMEIATKKEFEFKASFDIIHDWGYLDEEKMKEDLGE